ncbi:helix-turn-helix transcriptional regulator [Streptomyces sp. NBC_01498]|uniref:helix-turn-helix transcriptional regulator n=1 Tax=Streptomyces sp. NBC_01498 TaxID=2975870 RepID=UPI002E7C134B|nr:helix-turn-helix transcriptional regulator [Streptomyces sp. NBC_01498]WTL25761.1 helix-turn-helix transcriptional regulator [Streptomyces sp. NBC_01498]
MATTELGAALRRWRDQVAPGAVGLASGGHRRAAGLRREELAGLAGISVDYITRLEQGRSANPSAQVVEALARALRLSDDARALLFQLAGLALPGPETIPTHIAPSVQRMLDRLTNTPVVVFDAAWNQLLANPLYTALMGEWHGKDLNAVWRNFLGTGSRVRHTPESRGALQAHQAAALRATASRYPADPRLRDLITALRDRSSHFEELWQSGTTAPQRGARKTVDHPRVGALTLDCDTLNVTGSDLYIMVYTAEPGSRDADRLALLSVLGTQTFAG